MIAGTVCVAETGLQLLQNVKKAESFQDRTKGLLGCTGLAEGEGLVIAPCSSIHTFFMKFPLDIMYLDRDGTIVKLVERLNPWNISVCFGAAEVLETAVGLISSSGLQVGDRIIWEAKK